MRPTAISNRGFLQRPSETESLSPCFEEQISLDIEEDVLLSERTLRQEVPEASITSARLEHKIPIRVQAETVFWVNLENSGVSQDFLESIKDPFTQQYIREPMITPEGKTCSRSSIGSRYRAGSCFSNRLMQEILDSLLNSGRIPTDLNCPITLHLLVDPVVASDGYTYEREAIIEAFRLTGKSPLTREKLKPIAYRNFVVSSILSSNVVTSQREPKVKLVASNTMQASAAAAVHSIRGDDGFRRGCTSLCSHFGTVVGYIGGLLVGGLLATTFLVDGVGAIGLTLCCGFLVGGVGQLVGRGLGRVIGSLLS